jgi:flagellar hook-associated protein 2
MASASVSGLVSGMDTATIISQLMQVEAAPQTLLKTRLSSEQGLVSTLQSLNAKFAALTTRAHDLAKPTAWAPLTTTSSSTQVSATAGVTTVPGTLSFTVNQTATPSRITFGTTARGTDVVATSSVRLTKSDGSHLDLDAGTGTLDELVNAVNGANAGVTATKVRLDSGEYRVSLLSKDTGTASRFSLTNADGTELLGGAALAAESIGTNASITVGADTITSGTNTFTGLTQGLDVTIKPGTAAGTAVDVTVARDASKAQGSMQSLVDAANEILSTIDSLTAYNATTKSSGQLAGDATVRELRSKVLDAVTRAADGSSMASLGLQTDRTGKLTFDTAKFTAAYAADPNGVAKRLGAGSTDTVPGFASRLETAGKIASDSSTGILTQSVKGHQSSVTNMQDSIASWDIRLAQRQEALNRQFSALEVALGKMQDQASWLSGQIASLPTSSSNS